MTPRQLIEPARLAGTAVLRTQSDDRLVDLVRDGNDRAFEAIVHRYRRPLLRYCGRFLSPARAEDAVQQAFVNAFGALSAGDAEIQLRPWLYRIAHNSALNVLRQTGQAHEQVSEEIDGVETPPQALERGERLRKVVAAVQDLPERQRSAIVLQALEGRSYQEIADELGVSDGAVRQLLHRARGTLRDGMTALTPPWLLARMGGVVEAPVAERVAQVVAGAGGGAAVAKGVALLATAGAAVGGAVGGAIPGGDSADPERRGAPPAQVADARSGGGPSAARGPRTEHRGRNSARARRSARASADPVRAEGRRTRRGDAGEARREARSDDRREGRSGERPEPDDHEATYVDDDHSGPGGGDDDGYGDSSGPGSGHDDDPVLPVAEPDYDNSGSGSYSSGRGSDDDDPVREDRSGTGSGSG